MTDQPSPRLPPEILSHYGEGVEQPRLLGGTSRLEFTRTQLILQRFLPGPPARILDVGGGPGAYAHWLTHQGYTVHLLDAVPLHVEQARAAANGYTVELGDARGIPAPILADLLAVEGPGWILPEFEERWRDDRRRQELLEAVARVEREPSMLGVSAHLLAVARHPGS